MLTLNGVQGIPCKPAASFCRSVSNREGIIFGVFAGAILTGVLAGCLHMSAVTIIFETTFLFILE